MQKKFNIFISGTTAAVKFRQVLAISFFTSSILFASCTTADSVKMNNEHRNICDKSAINNGNTMLKALKENDYPLFSSGLSENLRRDFSKKDFESGRKHITGLNGDISGYRYIGKLSGPIFTTFLWAVKFDRTNREKEHISREILFKTTAGEVDNKVETVSFGFTQ